MSQQCYSCGCVTPYGQPLGHFADCDVIARPKLRDAFNGALPMPVPGDKLGFCIDDMLADGLIQLHPRPSPERDGGGGVIFQCMRYVWKKTPRGWTLMAYERNGKPVCRYFYPEGER